MLILGVGIAAVIAVILYEVLDKRFQRAEDAAKAANVKASKLENSYMNLITDYGDHFDQKLRKESEERRRQAADIEARLKQTIAENLANHCEMITRHHVRIENAQQLAHQNSVAINKLVAKKKSKPRKKASGKSRRGKPTGKRLRPK